MEYLQSRVRRALSVQARRLRSVSMSSTTCDESAYTTVANSGVSTPRSTSPERSFLAMTALTSQPTVSSSTESSLSPPDLGMDAIDGTALEIGLYLAQSALNQFRTDKHPVIARSMLIDSIKYMHKSLPLEDLSADEKRSLEDALSFRYHTLASTCEGCAASIPFESRAKPNLLRSSTARVVCFTLGLLMLVVPIAVSALNWLLAYERRHQLVEKTIHGTGQLAKTAGIASLTISGTLVKSTQSRVGRQFLSLFTSILGNVVDGISDGIDASIKARQDPCVVISDFVGRFDENIRTI